MICGFDTTMSHEPWRMSQPTISKMNVIGTYSLMKRVLQHFPTNDYQSSLDIVKHRISDRLAIATKKEVSSSLGKRRIVFHCVLLTYNFMDNGHLGK